MNLRLALALLAALAAPAAAGEPAPAAVETGRLTWRGDFSGFGAWSGIEVSDDGIRFTAVSDRGRYATGRLVRDGDRLTAVELIAQGPLLDPRGNPVAGRDVDAEGLATGPDGTLLVSFEANHRVWAYPDIAGPATPIPGPRDFRSLQNNSALEALAADADGAVYAIPERSGKLDRPFPVYRRKDGAWSIPFSVPRRPPHLVTGADIGPDGRLYVLERDFQGLLGFASRVRSFAITPEGLSDETLLLDSRLATYDNLEGISVWRDADGGLRMTLISDDNLNFLQRTEIVEFRLPDPHAATSPRPRPRAP